MSKFLLDIFGNVVGQCRQPFFGEDWVGPVGQEKRYTMGFRDGKAGAAPNGAKYDPEYTLGYRDGTARRIHAESVRAGKWAGQVGNTIPRP